MDMDSPFEKTFSRAQLNNLINKMMLRCLESVDEALAKANVSIYIIHSLYCSAVKKGRKSANSRSELFSFFL